MGFLSLSPTRGEEWKRGQIRIHRTHVALGSYAIALGGALPIAWHRFAPFQNAISLVASLSAKGTVRLSLPHTLRDRR
ncbi:hypothetical protein [Scytonema sp. PRP1]|uniref:hypothetical protein n=1 Tax=Scytonema sp. PRP1 TaxID=3120513 RepID=UPI002FD25B65